MCKGQITPVPFPHPKGNGDICSQDLTPHTCYLAVSLGMYTIQSGTGWLMTQHSMQGAN